MGNFLSNMTEEQKTRLYSFFQSQAVSEDDRQFWVSQLEGTPFNACEKIIELFEAFPGEIASMRVLQEKRGKALSEADPSAWEQFCKEEEEYFAKLVAA